MEKFVNDLKAKAEAGDAQAQHELGLCYEKGDGVTADRKRAADWLIRAAEQGYEKAIAKLQELNLQ